MRARASANLAPDRTAPARAEHPRASCSPDQFFQDDWFRTLRLQRDRPREFDAAGLSLGSLADLSRDEREDDAHSLRTSFRSRPESAVSGKKEVPMNLVGNSLLRWTQSCP